MMEELNMEGVFSKLEKKAKLIGAEFELIVDRADRLSISFQNGKINKFDSSDDRCAGLRIVADGHSGYAYSESLTESALEQCFDAALANSRFIASAPSQDGLIERLMANSAPVGELGDLFNDSLAQIPLEEKIERARILEAAAFETDSRIASVPYAGYSETDGELQILSSRGVRRRQRWTASGAHCYSLAKSGEESRMAGERTFSRDAFRVEPRKVAETSARLALAKLGAVMPETGRYPVVLDAEAAMSFIGLIADYFSAKAVDQRKSIYAHDLGKRIASPHLALVDDPHYKGGMNTRAFDGEGAPTREIPIIVDGVLRSFLTNSHYAAKMNLPHTASAVRAVRAHLEVGPSNLVVKPGSKSRADLLASAARVIYVTEVTGLHAGFRPGSGDFSLQSEGELWENGQRSRALCNFVISGNVRELLEGIEAVSNRVLPPKTSVITPDLLIRELSVAGQATLR